VPNGPIDLYSASVLMVPRSFVHCCPGQQLRAARPSSDKPLLPAQAACTLLMLSSRCWRRSSSGCAEDTVSCTGSLACEHSALTMHLGARAGHTSTAQTALPVHHLKCQSAREVVQSATSISFRQHALPHRDWRRQRHAATPVQSFTAGSAVTADADTPAHSPSEPQV
jgi:hypothetical protein